MSVALLLGVGLWAAAEDAREAAIKAELKQLDGVWERTSLIEDGQEIPPPATGKLLLVFQGDKGILKSGDKVLLESDIVIDPTRSPRWMNIKFTLGPLKGMTSKAIYELKEDAYRVCMAPPGGDRPTAFASKKGSGTALATYKRHKP